MERLYTRKLKTVLQSRYIISIITIIVVINSIIVTNIYPYKSKFSKEEKTFIGIITTLKIDGDKLNITLKSKEKLVLNYIIKNKKEKDLLTKNLKLGDKIKVVGELTKPAKNILPNQFNYQNYLYQHHIYYILNANKIIKIQNNTSIFYELKNQITIRINKIDKTGYIRTFILGDKNNLDNYTLETYRENGISHLFAISGMHITLLTELLLLIINKITYKNIYKYSILLPFLLFYLFLTNYSASILRAVIMFTVSGFNKSFNLKISKRKQLLITLIAICLINPFMLYDIGFQFSYIISCSLVIYSKKIKNIILRNIYTSYICLLASLPINIYYFYQINILSCIYNLIMIPLISVIIFPLTIIVCIIPKIAPLYTIIINILEKTNYFLSHIDILKITFAKPSIVLIICLYIIIIITLKKPIYIAIIILLLAIYKIYPNYSKSMNITFIDVGQGDSIVININKKNVLIDTGGIITKEKEKWQKRRKEFTNTINITIPYMKSKGINKINYLILTHGDFDHMGWSINLVNNFKVEKVIFNCGEYNDLEQELIKVLDKKKIKYYSCIKELNIDSNKLYFLQTKEYDNENDNSNVIYTELNGYRFMLMGDASTTTEKEILDRYNLSNIDVLKVGHHGSKTSSGREFIDEINPKYSIISVGKNNRYGHPNKEVLNNLKNSRIYRTDEDGSIMFKIKNNKLEIETCSP